MTIVSRPQEELFYSLTAREILSHIRTAWKLVVALSFFGALIGLFLGLLARDTFTASTIVRPVSSVDSPNTLQALGSQLGSLGELAGLADRSSDDTNYKLALLRSRAFGERFIARRHLQAALAEHLGPIRFLAWHPTPTPARIYKEFDRNVRSIDFDKKSGLITVQFSWDDPEDAALWANDYVAMANEEARQRLQLVTASMLAELQKEAAKNNLAFLSEAITRISERQMQTLILVHSKPDFAFEIIDPAQPPDQKSSPARMLWTLIGAASGLSIGLTIALARLALRTSLRKVA
jgi:uncharacterized protein involved in exopolysaccharide biosynthesis